MVLLSAQLTTATFPNAKRLRQAMRAKSSNQTGPETWARDKRGLGVLPALTCVC
jgi:energy-coupling factor transporter transmembrane protein EcfT